MKCIYQKNFVGDHPILGNMNLSITFLNYGDGEFFDNFNNCYFVDSAPIAIFIDNWTIDLETDALGKEIMITAFCDNQIRQRRLLYGGVQTLSSVAEYLILLVQSVLVIVDEILSRIYAAELSIRNV